MSYSLNSLKGGISGLIYRKVIGVIQGDTRSLDKSPYYGTAMEVLVITGEWLLGGWLNLKP